MTTKRFLGTFALLSCCALAQAQTTDGRGVYLYIGGGGLDHSAKVGDAAAATATNGAGQTTSLEQSGGAFRFGGGFRINQYFAAEAGYSTLGKIRFSAANAGMSPTITEHAKQAWTLAAVGFIPLGKQFDIFGKLGIAYTRSVATSSNPAPGGAIVAPPASQSDNAPMIGVGFDFTPANSRWLIRGEYEHITKYKYARVADMRSSLGAAAQPGGELENSANILSINVGYRFY